MSKKRLRTKKFINAQVQGAFLLQLLLHWALFLIAAFVLLMIWQVLSGPFRPVGEHLTLMWERFSPVVIVLALLMPAFLLDSIKLSHRVTGPMVRLSKEFQKLAAGKRIAPVRFREKDFWQELAEQFNQAIARIALDHPDRSAETDEKAQRSTDISAVSRELADSAV